MPSGARVRLARRTPFFYGWAVVGAAGSTMFVRNSAANLTIAVFLVPMSESLDWSRTLIVGAVSVAGFASMIASPLSGWALQRFGPRVLLTGAVLLLGGVVVALRWVDGPVEFYLLIGTARVIFSSPIQIGAATVVAQWFSRARGRATASLFVMHSLGMGLFPLMAQLLINQSDGEWRMAWFWLGLLVWIVALPPLLGILINRPEDAGLRPDGDVSTGDGNPDAAQEEARDGRSWTLRQAVHTPAMWMLAMAGGLTFFIHTGVNLHQAAFLRDQGISANVAASALTVMAAGTGLGSVMWGWLLDHLPERQVYAAVAIWLGVIALMFLLVDSVPMAFTASALFGIGLGGLLVVPPVVLANYFGRKSLGAIRGVTEPFASGGQAIGAIGGGIIFDLSGSYTATFPVFSVAALAAVVLILVAGTPRRARPAAPGSAVA